MTCLDCFNCKIVFPINKDNPLKTSFVLNPCSHYKRSIRKMRCKAGQWISIDGTVPTLLYSHQNIRGAKLGNSRYLNQADRCNFKDVEEEE